MQYSNAGVEMLRSIAIRAREIGGVASGLMPMEAIERAAGELIIGGHENAVKGRALMVRSIRERIGDLELERASADALFRELIDWLDAECADGPMTNLGTSASEIEGGKR